MLPPHSIWVGMIESAGPQVVLRPTQSHRGLFQSLQRPLLFFSSLQIISILKEKATNSQEIRDFKNPILVGIIFTILNPFFLVWWFTIGSKLISDAVINFGIIEGIFIIFLSHIWMDYFWLWLTSFMINKGKSVIKEKVYRIFVFTISVILGIYGIYLLFTSLNIITK